MKSFPSKIQLRDISGTLAIPAVSQGETLRRFSMHAYTGEPVVIEVGGKPVNLIIELAGVRAASQKIPALKIHELEDILGHTTSVLVDESGIHTEGVLSGASEDTACVIESSDNGFPWQASAGLSFDNESLDLLPAGRSEVVNGRTVVGPMVIARRSLLNEVSFTPIGADARTSSLVMSTHPDGNTVTIHERPIMANDPNPAPQTPDLETLVAQAKTDSYGDGLKDAGARLSALKAKFPDEPEFVLAQFEKGHDVPKASEDFCEVLKARLSAQQAGGAKPVSVVASGGGEDTPAEKPATAKLNALVNAKMSAGMPRHEAMAAAFRADDSLRQAYVAECNAKPAK